jgi:hypothetical protein
LGYVYTVMQDELLHTLPVPERCARAIFDPDVNTSSLLYTPRSLCLCNHLLHHPSMTTYNDFNDILKLLEVYLGLTSSIGMEQAMAFIRLTTHLKDEILSKQKPGHNPLLQFFCQHSLLALSHNHNHNHQLLPPQSGNILLKITHPSQAPGNNRGQGQE